MIGLVFKKTAYQTWDNAVLLFALNLAMATLVFFCWFLVTPLASIGPAGIFCSVTFLAAVVMAGQALVTAHLDGLLRRRRLRVARLAACAIVGCLAVPAVLMLLACAVLLLDLARASSGGWAVALGVFAGWLGLLGLGAFLFLPALVLSHGADGLAIARDLLRLLFDNPFFVAALLLAALPILILTLGLLPGPAGLALLFLNAAEMRLERYAPAFAAERRPDWSLILAEERRLLERRTLRAVFQPWRG